MSKNGLINQQSRKSRLSQVNQSHILPRTNTVQPVLAGFVACVACALVAADHIDALAVPAQPVTQLAFIYICKRRKPRSKLGKFKMK